MRLYLDYNASTPVDQQVLEAMCSCMSEAPGNPSSTHQFGRAVRARIDQAREQVAALVGAQPGQVVFTSGGTEANNLAMFGVSSGQKAGHVAVSAIEHPSILEPAQALVKRGWELDLIGCNASGQVMAEHLGRVIKADTRLVSVMAANNETGAIQDIPRLAEATRAVGAIFHTDAVQAVGKIPLDFESSGAHLMSLSAHKIYGPKGTGALIFDRSLELLPQILGGGQEKGLRSGTENLPGIAGFGVAAEQAKRCLTDRSVATRLLRERLENGLKRFPEVTVFASQAERLPNTVQLAIEGIDGEALLMQLDREGVAVSSGSACSADSSEPSHVLLAMGVEAQAARGAIRVSLGKETRQEEIDYLLQLFERQIQWLQKAGHVAGW